MIGPPRASASTTTKKKKKKISTTPARSSSERHRRETHLPFLSETLLWDQSRPFEEGRFCLNKIMWMLSTKNQEDFFLQNKKKGGKEPPLRPPTQTMTTNKARCFPSKGWANLRGGCAVFVRVCVINCSRLGMIIFLLLGSRLCSLPRKKKIDRRAYHQSIGFSKEPISSLNREISMSVNASLPKFSSGEVTKEYSMAD